MSGGDMSAGKTMRVLGKAVFLGFSAGAGAFTPFPQEQAQQYTNQLNQLRSDLRAGRPPAAGMQQIKYSTELEAALNQAVVQNGEAWLLEPAPDSPPNHNFWLNGQALGLSLTGFIPLQDTCGDMAPEDCPGTNFNFRTVQGTECFNFDLCNTTAYDRFHTCTNKPQTAGTPCAYFFDYYPQFLIDSITDIAVLALDIAGYKPPPQQNQAHNGKSYWLFMKGKLPQNDQPYAPGPACSLCDPGQTCVHGLCAYPATDSPSAHPSEHPTTPMPTTAPSAHPSFRPTPAPTAEPTPAPTVRPSARPHHFRGEGGHLSPTTRPF